MYKEEIILRHKRTELEGFAERQRLLKELNADRPSGFRHRLAVVLLTVAKRLEPELMQEQMSIKPC